MEQNNKNTRGAAKRPRYLFAEELKRNRLKAAAWDIIAVIFLLVLFLASHFTYSRAAQKYFTQQAYDTMTEVSAQISQVVTIRVQYWYEQLDFLSSTFAAADESAQGLSDYAELLDTVNAEGYTPFDEVGLITKNGYIVLEGGTRYKADDDPFVAAVAACDTGEKLAGKLETANIKRLRGKVLIAQPVESAYTGADAAAAVVVAMDSTSISKLLETDIFGVNMSYVVICDASGNVIVDTKTQNSFDVNLFDTLAKYASENTIAELKDDLLRGNSGTLELMGESHEFLTYYTPVVASASERANASEFSARNWRLMILTRADVLTRNISSLFDSSRTLLYIVLVLFGAVVMLFVWMYTRKLNRALTLRCVDYTTLLRDRRFERDAELLLSRPNACYAVVSYNIVRFKLINKRIGHDMADEVLTVAGKTINSFLRPDEAAAHSFADRFTVLLRMDTPDGEGRIRLLEQALLDAEYPEQVHPHFSIGVYRVPEGSRDITAAMDCARLAQSATREKHSAINNMVVYTPEMSARQAEEGRLIEMAEDALKNHDFLVYYQLKRNLQGDGWAGSEALVRWKDPELGFIYPSKFVPLFERTGFIVKLDKYVFETVCRDLRAALDNGSNVVPVSVNLSRCHFEEDNYLDEYEQIMARYNVPHELIEFEVTETLVAKNPDSIRELIDRLHAIGCKCSLDDFGTGYSSLSMVQDFDFDTIKLDRSFFYGYKGFTSDSALIVETLILLSHQLHKTVISEGIENAEQVEFLREKKCDMIQGYYFAKPAPVAECHRILNPEPSAGPEQIA